MKSNISNILFVSFEQGGGGHRLARVICTLPSVYWYSHPDNGKRPWNIHFDHSSILQRYVAKSHFNRLLPGGMLPPTWDYVDRFIPDEETYWEVFEKEFERVGGNDIEQLLIYPTHMSPQDLITQFPKCKVISIVKDNVDELTDRYLHTTAIFPAHMRAKWIDGENTEYGKFLTHWTSVSENILTIRDVWAIDNFGSLYQESYAMVYRNHIHQDLTKRLETRMAFQHPNVHVYTTKKDLKEFIAK